MIVTDVQYLEIKKYIQVGTKLMESKHILVWTGGSVIFLPDAVCEQCALWFTRRVRAPCAQRTQGSSRAAITIWHTTHFWGKIRLLSASAVVIICICKIYVYQHSGYSTSCCYQFGIRRLLHRQPDPNIGCFSIFLLSHMIFLVSKNK